MVEIDDAARLAETPVHGTALAAIEAGIEAAHPRNAIRDAVTVEGDTFAVGGATYDLAEFDEVIVLGGGKAAGAVAVELEALLGDRIAGGAVVVPEPVETDTVEVIVGGHPLPDAGSVVGAERLLELAEAADERTLVLAVITGGGSATIAAPADDIGLEDLRVTTEALLDAGAAIDELNAVRKHVSAVKGGQLARVAAPATIVSLLVSDVVGDDPGVIASGPTAPDETTFGEAIDACDRYGVDPPASVRRYLEAGARGEHPETPHPGDSVFDRVDNRLLVVGWTAIAASRAVVDEAGYTPCVLSSRLRGEAREIGLSVAAVAEEVADTGNPVSPPAALLTGGETTVSVRGDGTGGPNQELALRAATELPPPAVLASVDTDGEDGSTDAAGALVDSGTVDDPGAASRALSESDAYGYLESRDALIRTGPTGTNVNDLCVVLVTDSE